MIYIIFCVVYSTVHCVFGGLINYCEGDLLSRLSKPRGLFLGITRRANITIKCPITAACLATAVVVGVIMPD